MILTCLPALPLRPYVRYYYQVEEQLLVGSQLQPVPARSLQIIEFMFGTPYRVQRIASGEIEDAQAVAIVGAQTHRRVNLMLGGSISAFTITFEPGGCLALFSVPADELTNADFDATTVLGHALAGLHERLGEVDAFEARTLVMDKFLCERLPASASGSPAVWAAHELRRTNGGERVRDLAAAAALSVRQFERRFSREIGMSPKVYARVVRFEAALRLKAAQPKTQWTEIAHRLGYFDQMHMVHDFNRLSGESPSAVWDQLDMFVEPELRTRGAPDTY